MKWKFSFSATYPKGHRMAGGTFIDGELECDVEDIPEASVRILKNAFLEWESSKQSIIEFSIKPQWQ